MKKFLIVVCIFILVFVLFEFFNYKKQEDNSQTNSVENNMEIVSENVRIENGKIYNEDLIDKFMEDCNTTNEIISLQIENDNEFVQVDFVPDSISRSQAEFFGTEEEPVNVDVPETELDFELASGYYILTKNRQEYGRYSKIRWQIERTVKEDQVELVFNTSFYDIAEIPVICKYNLKDSNYKASEYVLNYLQRKDLGAKKIIEKNTNGYDFDIYTIGGDVNIIVEDDMGYHFEDALKQKIVTIDDILNQAKVDTKYGICKKGYYSDGGTEEFMYPEYSIIKYNTLDGNTDFVITPAGDFRNMADKILYK